MFAGAVVAYKTINQNYIAISSTESELYALAETGKMMLYIRSILDDLDVKQSPTSIIYEDNQGCIHITEARKPTKRTRHIDIRNFVILDWIERDLMEVKKIPIADNASDTLTKALPRITFHRHNDTLMGRRDPIITQKDTINPNDHNGSGTIAITE